MAALSIDEKKRVCDSSRTEYSEQAVLDRESAKKVFTVLVANIQSLPSLNKKIAFGVCQKIHASLGTLIHHTQDVLSSVENIEYKLHAALIINEKKCAKFYCQQNDNMRSFTFLQSRLVKLNQQQEGCDQQIHSLDSEIAYLNRKIEEEDTCRTDALVDMIPFVGFFGGLATGRYFRMIPFASQIAGLISVIVQDKEAAEAKLEIFSKQRQQLRSDKDSVLQQMEQKKEEKKTIDEKIASLQSERDLIDQDIKKTGKELTNIKNVKLILKQVVDKYQFLRRSVTEAEDYIAEGMPEEVEISSLLKELCATQRVYLSIELRHFEHSEIVQASKIGRTTQH